MKLIYKNHLVSSLIECIISFSAIVQAREGDETDYVPMFGGIIAGVLIFAFVIIIVAMFVRYNYR